MKIIQYQISLLDGKQEGKTYYVNHSNPSDAVKKLKETVKFKHCHIREYALISEGEQCK